MDAFEVERRRIERHLHDGAQQRLVGLAMVLGLAALELHDGPRAARELVDQAAREASAALADLHRLIRGIHPQVLADHGLAAATAELADRSPVPATVDLEAVGRLPSTVESSAYFVIAEALTNAAKHARATLVSMTGRVIRDRLVIEVHDDGSGGADPVRRYRVDRARRPGRRPGRYVDAHQPLGGPTVLRLEVPCSAS